MKHCSSLANDPEGLRGLHGLCREKLKAFGVGVSKPHKAKTRHFPGTPGKKSTAATISTVFGRPLRDLAPTSVLLDGGVGELRVPHFLLAILNYLSDQLETDGLFRKAGSAGRQRALRAEIEEAETFFIGASHEQVSALDVGSLLKQWLRELPEPLIPLRFHDTFIKCCKLPNPEAKIEAILSACLLLPPLHASSLTCLVRFLSKVAANSASNQMDAMNLAIVFTPSLFPVNEDLKKVDPDLTTKLEIVEILIRSAESVCMIDQSLDEALQIPTFASNDDLMTDEDEDYEVYGAGPSARRRKSVKKKRRSGSLSRVFTATMKGLHKAIRSTTPAGIRSDFSSAAPTPIFQSPRLPVKRKVSVDEPDMSPNSKHRKAALESSFTPKVVNRARSVSIKNRFKRKKSLVDGAKFKEPTLIIHHHFDGNTLPKTPSLPSKPTFTSFKTPGTPASMEYGMSGGQDLSADALGEDEPDYAAGSPNLSLRSCRTSLGSMDSLTSSKSTCSGRVVKRRSKKSRSPSERKIGVARRRSQELAHKKALMLLNKDSLNLPILDESHLKSQLRRGKPNTFRVKPSPMKIENATPDGRKTTRIKISFREGQLQEPKVHIKPSQDHETSKNSSLKVNESLSNLRQDISSMIEKSFGPFQDPEDHEVTFGQPDNDLDKFTLEELTLPRTLMTTRSMRRQSSAYEVLAGPRKDIPMTFVRRQSSAFELAALKNDNNLNRGAATRASLKNRNSSVKDLVKKLEVTTVDGTANKRMSISTSALPRPCMTKPELMLPSPPMDTPMKPPTTSMQERGRPRSRNPTFRSPTEIEEAKDDFPTSNDNEWMDANDFFNSKSRVTQLAFEETPGCKRSSIIRIRTERRGLVSRNVETFTKPALPPPMITPRRGPRPAARTPASAVTTRRTSARMGIAGKTPSLTNGASAIASRRQTLTGIRTSASTATTKTANTTSKPSPLIKDEPIYGNIECKAKAPNTMVTSQQSSGRSNTPKSSNQTRKSKRIEGRRFLTIGYDGEVRSPLKERQNTIVANVKRSKSAQTPANKNKVNVRQHYDSSAQKENEDDQVFTKNLINVHRSVSLRSPKPQIVVPTSLKETIYDVTTPKSEKVKRHLSDRVVTPRGGRQEAAPFIKKVLVASRTPNHYHVATARKSPRMANLH